MAYTITILDSDEITDLRYGVGSKAFNEFIELLGITLNGALLTDESTLSHFFLSIPTSKEIIELAGSSYPDGYFAAKDLWDAEISAKNQSTLWNQFQNDYPCDNPSFDWSNL